MAPSGIVCHKDVQLVVGFEPAKVSYSRPGSPSAEGNIGWKTDGYLRHKVAELH